MSSIKPALRLEGISQGEKAKQGKKEGKKEGKMRRKAEVVSFFTEGQCKMCHQPLTRIRWNTRGHILFCTNYNCQCAHQPQGWIEGN